MPNYALELADLKTAADYQRLIDAIETILCSDTDPEPDVIETVHGKLLEAVKNVNGRLRQCEQLLEKGLRAEGIQQCQTEPNLLDLFTTLDFPELETWNDYAEQFGLNAAPELMVDVAGELNDAFAAQQPLAELMYAHRVHALARSPLPVRIDIMRRLVRLDAENPVWEEDLRAFEKARLKQVRMELQAAVQQNSVNAAAQLQKEVTESKWSVKLPKSLVKQALEAHSKLCRQHAHAQMEKLEPGLNEAHAAADAPRARGLRTQWERHAAVACLSLQDPLLELVAPALQWLNEVDRREQAQAEYDAAVAALEDAIARRATKNELRAYCQAVLQCGQGIPSNLEQRLNDLLAQLDAEAAKRRKRKWIAGTVAAVVVVSASAFSIFYYLRAVEQSTHVANLSSLIESSEFEPAQQYVADLEQNVPRVFASAEIQQLKANLDAAVAEDQKRREAFDRAIAQATTLALTEPTLENPKMENFDTAFALLEKAYNDIAASDAERGDVEALVDRIKSRQTELQQQLDDRFGDVAEALEKDIDDLDPTFTDYLDRLKGYGREVAEFKGLTYVTRRLRDDRVLRLQAKVETKVRAEEAAQEEDKALLDLKKTIGLIESFRRELKKYVDNPRFAGRPRHRDFQQVLERESDLWVGFDAWDHFIEQWSGKDMLALSADQCTQILSEAKSLQAKHAGFPAEPNTKVLATRLHLITTRAQSGLARVLETLLDRDIIHNVYWLRTKEGNKSYYSLKLPTLIGTGSTKKWNIRYLVDPTDLEEKFEAFSLSQIANTPTSIGFDWMAPQAVFSGYALELLETLNSENWEETFITILALLYTDQRMDSFLKVFLMLEVQNVAIGGSDFLRTALEKNHRILGETYDSLDPDTNWVHPDDEGGRQSRRKADLAIRKLEDPKSAMEALRVYQKSMKSLDLGPRYEWTGVLHRDRKNQWTCSFSDLPDSRKTADLFVLYRLTAGAAPKFVKIGALNRGQVVVSGSQTSLNLAEGRPVFELSTDR